MPQEPTEKDMAVFSGNVKGLSEEHLQELKEKFGLEIKLKSTSDTINRAISKMDLTASYDRTHPGYDRSYDKDPDVAIVLGHDAIVNPGANKPI